MLIKMKIKGILLDPNTNSYIIILRDEEGKEVLPLWVDRAEGSAISFALEGVVPPRPLTHDLIKNILTQLGSKIVKIVIDEFKQNTFYASIYLSVGDSEIIIDTRPSDAIALALRAQAPIFVSEDLIKKRISEGLDKWLESLRPEDFGKYSV